MKLLITSAVCENIYQKAYFLKSKGIGVRLSDQEIAGRRIGAHIGLWVLIDSQFDDANSLLKNPEHLVGNPLSEEEMLNLETSAKNTFSTFMEKAFNVSMLVIILATVIFLPLKSFIG